MPDAIPVAGPAVLTEADRTRPEYARRNRELPRDQLLEQVPFLRTYYLALIRKP